MDQLPMAFEDDSDFEYREEIFVDVEASPMRVGYRREMMELEEDGAMWEMDVEKDGGKQEEKWRTNESLNGYAGSDMAMGRGEGKREFVEEQYSAERIYLEDSQEQQNFRQNNTTFQNSLKPLQYLSFSPIPNIPSLNSIPSATCPFSPSPSPSSSSLSQPRPGKYRMLSSSQKRQIVQESFRTSLSHASKKYSISVNNICRWRNRCDRKAGAGRKVHDPQMEVRLLDWIQRVDGQMTRQMIRKKAQELSRDQRFKASKGWYQRFVTRNRAVMGRKGVKEEDEGNANHDQIKEE